MITYFIVLIVLVGGLVLAYYQLNKKSEEDKVYETYLKGFAENKNMIKLPPMTTNVAGVAYTNNDGVDRQSIIARTKAGERLLLLHDKHNKYDEDAIKVVRLNGEQIGFLSMDLSVEINSRLKRGSLVEAKIVKIINTTPKEVVIELQKYSRRDKK